MADRYLLLVEDKDDEHVFYHLLRRHRIPERFKIKDKEGIDNLLDTLEVELLASGLERLGIVVDANANIKSRWQAIRDILVRSGYDAPTGLDANGTIVEGNSRPRVGVWVMPNNTLPGALEDFVRFLVPAGDSLWNKAADCLAQIPEQDRRFPPERHSKAHIHTWLAWQEEPGAPLGLTITKRYLSADAPHARQLMDWIRRLFDL